MITDDTCNTAYVLAIMLTSIKSFETHVLRTSFVINTIKQSEIKRDEFKKSMSSLASMMENDPETFNYTAMRAIEAFIPLEKDAGELYNVDELLELYQSGADDSYESYIVAAVFAFMGMFNDVITNFGEEKGHEPSHTTHIKVHPSL